MIRDPIERIEKLLRGLIHEVMSSKYNGDWTTKFPKLNQSIRSNRNRKENKTRPYDLPIAYSQFSDLEEVLKGEAAIFEDIFGDYDKYMQFYTVAKELRNPVKHHREIKPHQQYLLIGIAGEFEDVIAKWRIGYPIQIEKTQLQYADLLKVTGLTNDAISSNLQQSIENWKNRFNECLKKIGIKNINITSNDFDCRLNGRNIDIYISTNPKAKKSKLESEEFHSITINIIYKDNQQFSLDGLLKALKNPYRHVKYHLVNNIDIVRLYEHAKLIAGIQLKSAGHGRNDNIEISVLNGELRLAFSKYSNVDQKEGGLVTATVGNLTQLWQFHNYLTPDRLIEFVLGEIPPRTLMHLFNLSQIRQGN